MAKNCKNVAGADMKKAPKRVGAIVKEMLRSDSPMAEGLRAHDAKREKGKTKPTLADVAGTLMGGINPNTFICVDLKTLLHGEKMMKIGKSLEGVLVRDSDDHFTFIEVITRVLVKRNPKVFDGTFITVTRRDDGSLRTNFKPKSICNGFDVDCYANCVAQEIKFALNGLIEKE